MQVLASTDPGGARRNWTVCPRLLRNRARSPPVAAVGPLVHGKMVAMAMKAEAAQPGRRRRWVALVALAVAGLAAGWVLFGGGSDGTARRTPGALTSAQEDYDGDRVRTVGVVRRFGPEDGATRLHFVVEDKDQNRVGLIGGDPARHVGRTVVVVGTFRFAPDVGRWIEVESLEER